MQEYLRKWNPIIQEWLRAYLYKTFKKLMPKSLAMLLILMWSAFEHDFALTAGFGYFMPVYLVEFGMCGKTLSQL